MAEAFNRPLAKLMHFNSLCHAVDSLWEEAGPASLFEVKPKGHATFLHHHFPSPQPLRPPSQREPFQRRVPCGAPPWSPGDEVLGGDLHEVPLRQQPNVPQQPGRCGAGPPVCRLLPTANGKPTALRLLNCATVFIETF